MLPRISSGDHGFSQIRISDGWLAGSIGCSAADWETPALGSGGAGGPSLLLGPGGGGGGGGPPPPRSGGGPGGGGGIISSSHHSSKLNYYYCAFLRRLSWNSTRSKDSNYNPKVEQVNRHFAYIVDGKSRLTATALGHMSRHQSHDAWCIDMVYDQ